MVYIEVAITCGYHYMNCRYANCRHCMSYRYASFLRYTMSRHHYMSCYANCCYTMNRYMMSCCHCTNCCASCSMTNCYGSPKRMMMTSCYGSQKRTSCVCCWDDCTKSLHCCASWCR